MHVKKGFNCCRLGQQNCVFINKPRMKCSSVVQAFIEMILKHDMLYFRYMLQYILTNLHRSSPNLQRPSLQLLYLSQAYTIKACQSVYHISPSIFSLNKNLFTKVVVLGPFLCYGLFHHCSGQLYAACFKKKGLCKRKYERSVYYEYNVQPFRITFGQISVSLLVDSVGSFTLLSPYQKKKKEKKNKQTEQKTKCSNRNTQPMLSLPLPLVFQQ